MDHIRNLRQRWKKDKGKKKQIFIFSIIVAKEVFDSAFDWLFFHELSSYDEGLIFGSFAFFLLCIAALLSLIGTVVSGIDIANKFRKLRNGISVAKVSITDLCVMYLEDIPQLCFGLYVALCRKEKSIWTILKAIILMIASCFIAKKIYKQIIKIMHKRRTRAIRQLPKKYRKKYFLASGYLVIALLSFFTFIHSWENTSLVENGKLHAALMQYVSKVGIFCNADDFQFPIDNFRSEQWIKVVQIDDILSYGEMRTDVSWDRSHLQIRTFYKGNNMDICYWLNETSRIYFTKTSNCAMKDSTIFYIHLKYVAPSTRHYAGDIQYNVRKGSTGSCDSISPQRVPTLRYFLPKVSQNGSEHLFDTGSEYTFYSEKDLKDINTKWQGNSCFGRGGVSPHLNSDIIVQCL